MSKKRRRLRGQALQPASPVSASSAEPPRVLQAAGRIAFTGWRKWAWRAALLVLVPAVILGFAEALLRLCGYGYPTTYFVATEGGTNLTTNPKFGWQFMPRKTATQPYPLLMAAQKPPGTFRIFILGESAAQGTPAPAFGFARILEVMLEKQFPEMRFEVVNTAMRGINSHVIRLIARECIRHEPDLFIVYMGNNEAVGLYMPEPDRINLTPHLGLLRTIQWIKATKLAQLMDSLACTLRKDAKTKKEKSDMAQFREKRLAADDPRKHAVYDNFQANLTDLCQTTCRSGAKVVVATVAVNLQDCPPLGAMHPSGLAPQDLSRWDAAYAHGTNAEARGLPEQAIPHYLEAARWDDHFADLHFRLGRCYRATGQLDKAREHYERGRDWDTLQFRTDSRLNRIVREVARSQKDPGLFLVDAEKAFAEHAASEGRLPGSRWFHEHVHLTFDGDYLLAQTILPTVVDALGLRLTSKGLGPGPRPVPTRQECAEALAFTAWDEVDVAAAMTQFTAKPPFLDQLDHAERQARAEAAIASRVKSTTSEDLQRCAVTYRAALARRPNDWQIHFNFGNLLRNLGDHASAATEYQAAVRLMPYFLPMRISLVEALWKTGRRDEARRQLADTLHIDPNYAPALDALAQITPKRPR